MRTDAPDVVLRPETPADADAIDRVVAAAFGSPVEAALVRMIRASSGYVPELSLVAVTDDEVVGHTMLSFVSIVGDSGTRRVLSLSPLAVHPARQRRGIGSALVHEAVARARARGEPLVCLEGDPRYYGRLGFEDARAYGIEFPLPDWAPPEAGQIRRLDAFDPSINGRVVYPEAFARAEALRGEGK